jgi:hypothetical protein
MDVMTHGQRLSKVQNDIEVLLACRPFDDFSPPRGYRSLVLLESVLLEKVSCGRPGADGPVPCSRRIAPPAEPIRGN